MDTRFPSPILAFLQRILLFLLTFLRTPKWENPHRGYENNYKGQIHCHSSAGDLAYDIRSETPSPVNVLNNYQSKGYKFVCLTDHNTVTGRPEGTSSIIFIRSVEDGRTYPHHVEVLGVNLQAAQLDAATYFDPDHDGFCEWDQHDCSNLPGRLYYYSAIQEAVTVLGHPKALHDWDLEDTLEILWDVVSFQWGSLLEQGYTFDELLSNAQAHYRDQPLSYTGIELYNASYSGDRDVAMCDDWWDQLLCQGKRVWGFGGDDSHGVNNQSFNRTWIVVNASDPIIKDSGEVTDDDIAKEILLNIKTGNFHTVIRSPEIEGPCPNTGSDYSGPTLKIKVLGNMIQVTTDPNCEIHAVYNHEWRATRVQVNTSPSLDGKSITGTFTPPATSRYARVEITQQIPNGERYLAFSQPLYNKKVETAPPDPCQDIMNRIVGLENARRRTQDFHEGTRGYLPPEAQQRADTYVDETQTGQDSELEHLKQDYDQCRVSHGLPPMYGGG